jgi:hypothetical protein
LGEDVLDGSINALLLEHGAPALTLLAVSSAGLFTSEDGGDSWTEFVADVPAEEAVVAVSAPGGLRSGAALLLGLSNGEVMRVAL